MEVSDLNGLLLPDFTPYFEVCSPQYDVRIQTQTSRVHSCGLELDS